MSEQEYIFIKILSSHRLQAVINAIATTNAVRTGMFLAGTKRAFK